MNKIEQLKEIMSLLNDKETPTSSDFKVGGSEIKIVILQRGWVFIGKWSQEGSKCTLTNAKNIRTWGTTKGLGEIASNGPTNSTKLDDVNDVSFHELTVVAIIDCDDKIWSKQL